MDTYAKPTCQACTYYCGPADLLVVMTDWIAYLGTSDVPWLIATVETENIDSYKRKIDELSINAEILSLDRGNVSVPAFNVSAMYAVTSSAKADWLFLTKFDVLPYSSTYDEGWLIKTISRLEEETLWGATGSFRPSDVANIDEHQGLTQCFSENFAIVNRERWHWAIQEENPSFNTASKRFSFEHKDRVLLETSVVNWVKRTDQRLLFVGDTMDKSVFHIQQWGQSLLNIREQYRQRIDVEPYLNRPYRLPRDPWTYHRWTRFYGCPKPPLIKRIRIALGAWRRQLTTAPVSSRA